MSEAPPDIPQPAAAPEPTCPHCLSIVRAEARYCPRCGGPVRKDVPPRPRPLPLPVVMSRISKSTGPGKQTLVFYVLWLISGVLTSQMVRGQGASTAHIILGMQIFDAALTVLWVLALRRDVFRLYAHSKGGARPYLVALLAAYPVAFLVHLFVSVLEKSFSLTTINYSQPFLDAGFGHGVILLSVCVQPAVIEELAFRGVIQTTLADVMRPAETILVAAIAFSIMHFSLVMFAPFVLLGVYLGWLRKWSGSLWPAMAAHFLHNSLALLQESRPIFPL